MEFKCRFVDFRYVSDQSQRGHRIVSPFLKLAIDANMTQYQLQL